MNYQAAMSHVRYSTQRVTRPCWNDREHVYPRMAYLINAYQLVRESGYWHPADVARVPEDLILKIEDRAGGYGLNPYVPEPEDLAAEDWELFFPPDDFAGSDLCHENIYPEDLWPEEGD